MNESNIDESKASVKELQPSPNANYPIEEVKEAYSIQYSDTPSRSVKNAFASPVAQRQPSSLTRAQTMKTAAVQSPMRISTEIIEEEAKQTSTEPRQVEEKKN